jgi:hypothetical protein
MKEGKDTTEFRALQSTKVWSIVGIILGAIIAGSGVILQLNGVSAEWIIGLGVVVKIAAGAQKAFVDAGYIKQRTELKKVEMDRDAAQINLDAALADKLADVDAEG